MHDWVHWIMNALPLVILLGLWLYFMRAMKGRNWWSVQAKQAELLEAQLTTLRQTNELLRKLLER